MVGNNSEHSSEGAGVQEAAQRLAGTPSPTPPIKQSVEVEDPFAAKPDHDSPAQTEVAMRYPPSSSLAQREDSMNTINSLEQTQKRNIPSPVSEPAPREPTRGQLRRQRHGLAPRDPDEVSTDCSSDSSIGRFDFSIGYPRSGKRIHQYCRVARAQWEAMMEEKAEKAAKAVEAEKALVAAEAAGAAKLAAEASQRAAAGNPTGKPEERQTPYEALYVSRAIERREWEHHQRMQAAAQAAANRESAATSSGAGDSKPSSSQTGERKVSSAWNSIKGKAKDLLSRKSLANLRKGSSSTRPKENASKDQA
ncbi:uncharacterized protein E0L32_005087 [Thyridium curvatum]|uniref:Uncharacterized protein n=1 Tax=Thyridium curvatum TaxID=1093900 RepID=A0A507AXL7_9PEZI|nr:uncharacterized protein E0L32_005087 [Thyridium curvatum]TPX14692.1 hypothetical protein E0L32_005087 [Thyridium curvatum]